MLSDVWHPLKPQPVRVRGLDRSNVSTLGDWHGSFIADHVRFGRDTVLKRDVKKDTVDAAVGGYTVLAEGRALAVPDGLTNAARATTNDMRRVVDEMFREHMSRGLGV